MEAAHRANKARETGQVDLFKEEDGGDLLPRDTYPPDVEEWSEMERLAYEREALGFYLSGHPLSRYAEELEGLATHTTHGLGAAEGGATVSVGGMMASVARRRTRKGDTMAIFSLEDLEGGVEVVVFPELYGRSQDVFMEEPPILVTGRLEVDESRTRILASELAPVLEARQRRTESVAIRMPLAALSEDLLSRLKGVLEEHQGGCPVYLELTDPGAFAMTLKAGRDLAIRPSRKMVASVEQLLGSGSVRLKGRFTSARPRARRAPRAH
jgi:DNA polymerase-3 subunit alpha